MHHHQNSSQLPSQIKPQNVITETNMESEDSNIDFVEDDNQS
jgi:hypothetical protein